MRRVLLPAAVLVLFASCVSTDRLAPSTDRLAPSMEEVGSFSATALPPVRFSELHYDNTGTDAGEAIEVSGPTGTDVDGWRIVLYNGTGGAVYRTDTLRTVIPATCDSRGVVVVNYPSNGIQNGSPDGMALVDAGGAVVEFLSYEGTFTAVGGPANGMLSIDIGVDEEPPPPAGQSLPKDATGWYGPVASSFGACNVKPPPPANTILIFGRSASEPALPVGFQDQLFAQLSDGNGAEVPTATFVWSSETPGLA